MCLSVGKSMTDYSEEVLKKYNLTDLQDPAAHVYRDPEGASAWLPLGTPFAAAPPATLRRVV